ncbi:MAG: hypothetical protein A2991_01100 [Candidatus Terrybacteria bacterium RIFCSPLOWO2_01_FULL_58_14]|uniref:Uncharacterized protein n=2 Tax=Candidatus Terryibacteriota TaxID=1817920 RepID=A0A1G2PVF1_9BACT|nr:MAG: hypothetical protein A2682_01645 [Candidatus Terrybacteria bacterium RIFCSPHIGHO2_01_FULL_58_15]OHA52304.1 MAG: hypothetical protein A2991_01100 [Candidatus Terrybacteria bacterium RIFCSPLOWO2_01_FULL_58_14]
MPDAFRWQKLSMRDQIGNIGAELFRAARVPQHDVALARQMLERALELVDLTIGDAKWQENPLPLLRLRNEIAKLYIGQADDIESVYALL